jgi:hypothetical protein
MTRWCGVLDDPKLLRLLTPEAAVVAKWRSFVDMHVWPIGPRGPRVDEWLRNFTAVERPWAAHLLDQFIFYGTKETEALLVGAVADLSRLVTRDASEYAEGESLWQAFLDTALFTYPTGEDPSVTDSGFTFARMVRQRLGMDEDAILDPAQVLQAVSSGSRAPVVFVDDFLGTGDQFMKTWHRPYEIADGTVTSFEDVLGQRGDSEVFYVPLLATVQGRNRVAREARRVDVHATHVLGAEYSAVSPEGLVWPDGAREAGTRMLMAASERAGVWRPATDPDECWQGYGGLGLSVAFEHGTPDASLPLFYEDSPRWKRLVQRS